MLDLSIRHAEPTQKLPRDCDVTEKFDGTKLSLLRTGEKTLVSYKGTILDPCVFPYQDSVLDDIREFSSGFSQYALVANQKLLGGCPDGTEVLAEFIQRKPTVLRQYSKYHDLFAIASAKSDYLVSHDHVFTFPREIKYPWWKCSEGEITNLKSPTRIQIPGHVGTYRELKEYTESLESSLGGDVEGCVVFDRQTDSAVKLVRDDQYDMCARSRKKAMTVGFERDQKYWDAVITSARALANHTQHEHFYNNAEWEANKRTEFIDIVSKSPHARIRVIDDIFLSAVIARSTKRTFSVGRVGFYPGAFKPLHSGHWRVIERASRECEVVVIVVSEADRQDVAHSVMFRAWRDIFGAKLPGNVILRFSKSPLQECRNEIENIKKYTSATVCVYTGDSDVGHKRATFPNCDVVGVSKMGISATEFRAALRTQAPVHSRFVPDCLSNGEMSGYVELLKAR